MSALSLDSRGVLTPCPSCGKTNRLSYAALGATTRCGHCHNPLPAPDAPIEVPDASIFQAMVATAAMPVVVDFWAPWCGPCRMMAPEVDQVARDQQGHWLIVKVNTEALPELGARFRIQSIPTLALFHNGHEVARVAGARPAADIRSFVSASLDS